MFCFNAYELFNEYMIFFPTAEHFPERTDVQCLHRWQKVLNPELVKGPWTKEVYLTVEICF